MAGNIQWEPLRDQVERLFANWEPGGEPVLKLAAQDAADVHLAKETTQTQIGIAYPSVPIGHDDYYAAQGAVNI